MMPVYAKPFNLWSEYLPNASILLSINVDNRPNMLALSIYQPLLTIYIKDNQPIYLFEAQRHKTCV